MKYDTLFFAKKIWRGYFYALTLRLNKMCVDNDSQI